MCWFKKKDSCKDVIKIINMLRIEVHKMECEVCTRDTEHWNNLLKIKNKLEAIIHYIQLSRS